MDEDEARSGGGRRVCVRVSCKPQDRKPVSVGDSRWRWYEPCGPGCGVVGEHGNVPEFVLPWTWEKKSTADTRATQTRIVRLFLFECRLVKSL